MTEQNTIVGKPPREPPRYIPKSDEDAPKVEKYDKFFLLTYLPEDEMWLELQAHSKQIKRFAYALHDKDHWTEDVYQVNPETKEYVLDDNGLPLLKHKKGDPKEPHVHLYLELLNNQKRPVGTVANWFKEYHGENTFCRPVGKRQNENPGACWKYLIHDSKACREEGKFEYPPDIRITNDPQYFNRFDLPFQGDKILNALIDLEAGFTYRECCFKYGRDFILHAHHIIAMYERIKSQERAWEKDGTKDI